jgi:hypothetical protein
MPNAKQRPRSRQGQGDFTFNTFKMLMDERANHSRELAKAERRLGTERDRRYGEVDLEREKALKIKETADALALTLAAALQAEKDDRKNDVLQRWDNDRNTFVTRAEAITQHEAVLDKIEAAVGPLNDFVQGTRSSSVAVAGLKANQLAYIAIFVAVISIIAYYVGNHIH